QNHSHIPLACVSHKQAIELKPNATARSITYSFNLIKSTKASHNILLHCSVNRKIKVVSGSGISPLTLSGQHTIIARGGIFTCEIRGEMKKCINKRKFCRWGKRCVLRT
ncbi:unnamed protein product, partial [Owenia fusiformis]